MKRQDRYIYPAEFFYDEGQEISVYFPDFDVSTSGVDDADAMLSARELLGITILDYEEDGRKLPAPTSLDKLSVEGGKINALIDVFMPSIRFAEKTRSVSRTVTLPAWLNAAAAEQGVNFSQVLQDALKEIVISA